MRLRPHIAPWLVSDCGSRYQNPAGAWYLRKDVDRLVSHLDEENQKLRDMLKRLDEHGCLKRDPPCYSPLTPQNYTPCTNCREARQLLEETK